MLTSIINSLGMIDSMGSLPEPSTLMAVVGPLIGPCCYEFSRQEAERVARGVGARIEQVWFRGARGVFVLDMRAAIRIALTTAGLDPGSIAFDARCTGCDPTLFSYRMGKDIERQVLVVWKTPDE
jgi:copper oxidase (laccase) domain-containing protein